MKTKKQVSEIVKHDLKEAAIRYNQKIKGLVGIFFEGNQSYCNSSSENPLAYEIRYANIRIAFVKRFPYGIHFQYFETENKVNILAVFHASRKPG